MVKMTNRAQRGTMEVKEERKNSKLICKSNKRRTRKNYAIQFELNPLWGDYFKFYYPDFLNDYIYRPDMFL